MTPWITKKNNRVNRVRQTGDDLSPGPEWEKVPDDWGGNPEDRLDWFDTDMRRIPDTDLVKRNIRKDNRGIWYNKNTRETKSIHDLDKEPGADWTKEAPLENEPCQKWDGVAGSWIVDTGAKEKAEKEQRIAEKKAAIYNAEQRIQRSLIAIQSGIATEEDDQYFTRISAEIVSLREELKRLLAA
jgi:hypothetical protein